MQRVTRNKLADFLDFLINYLALEYSFSRAWLIQQTLFRFSICVFVLGLVTDVTLAQPTQMRKKIVLIAGKKSHDPGEHEYLKAVRLLKVMMDQAPNIKGISTEIHANGWPADPTTLDDADAILIYADGTDAALDHDPIFVDDHWRVLQKQMARGCGLVVLHYSTFAPITYSQTFTELAGGYFDYESGKPGASGREAWYSAITIETALLKPAPHPIAQGLSPFELHEELYYKIHFRENDKRLKPVITTKLSGSEAEQTVAWAIERQDGGRGFGFTGGHFYDNWKVTNFRKLLLNAMVWVAKAQVPKEGVQSKFYSDDEVNTLLK